MDFQLATSFFYWHGQAWVCPTRKRRKLLPLFVTPCDFDRLNLLVSRRGRAVSLPVIHEAFQPHGRRGSNIVDAYQPAAPELR